MKVIRTSEEIVILPETHKRTLIWLHGFASSGEMYLDGFLQTPVLADCKVVMPTAPAQAIAAMDGEVHTAWYTRLGFTYHDSIEPSVLRVNSIIDREKLSCSQVVIGGFSQGAVLALMCGLSRYSGRVDAILAFSGFAMGMDVQESRVGVPVMIFHGKLDPLIPWSRALNTYKVYLAKIKAHVVVDEETGHEVNEIGLIAARDWLRRVLTEVD